MAIWVKKYLSSLRCTEPWSVNIFLKRKCDWGKPEANQHGVAQHAPNLPLHLLETPLTAATRGLKAVFWENVISQCLAGEDIFSNSLSSSGEKKYVLWYFYYLFLSMGKKTFFFFCILKTNCKISYFLEMELKLQIITHFNHDFYFILVGPRRFGDPQVPA